MPKSGGQIVFLVLVFVQIDEVFQLARYESFTARSSDKDAHHITHAVSNNYDVFLTRDVKTIINRFVTTDPHFLDRRLALERLCRGLRIVKPSELSTELAA